MKCLNIIMLVDAAGENVLMCRRVKPPYQGLYNLVGGKVEPGENGLHAAYRELREETGVTAADVTLFHLVTFSYPDGGAGLPPYALEAYVGRLRREVRVAGDENPLLWMPLTEDFFDMRRFAGEGSVGHVIESVRRYRPWMIGMRAPAVTIAPLTKEDLPLLAYDRGCAPAELLPMLAESLAQRHENRYYEQFSIRVEGCVVGAVSLYEQEDGTVSEGVEVFPTFRRCGFARQALSLLEDVARMHGYAVLTTQVRTNNAASLALHQGLGFTSGEPWINRRGREVVTFAKGT